MPCLFIFPALYAQVQVMHAALQDTLELPEVVKQYITLKCSNKFPFADIVTLQGI